MCLICPDAPPKSFRATNGAMAKREAKQQHTKTMCQTSILATPLEPQQLSEKMTIFMFSLFGPRTRVVPEAQVAQTLPFTICERCRNLEKSKIQEAQKWHDQGQWPRRSSHSNIAEIPSGLSSATSVRFGRPMSLQARRFTRFQRCRVQLQISGNQPALTFAIPCRF